LSSLLALLLLIEVPEVLYTIRCRLDATLKGGGTSGTGATYTHVSPTTHHEAAMRLNDFLSRHLR
jgi:hypothetical protein